MLLQLGATAAVVLLLVLVGASWAASRLAEREAVNDAAHTTNLLALTVVQPALQDGLVDGAPAAVAAFDRVVRERVLPAGIVRVKLWRPDGTVVYADDGRLVGQRFTLADDQREALSSPQTRAEVSDLDRSENEFERYGGKLLEVYRPVWTPSGSELLFEVYGDYAPVQSRAFDLWRGLAGVLTTSLLLLLVLLAPVVWRLLERLESAREQREDLLRRAVDASDRERRRIAADLHDGPVQDLVASSLAVAGAAARAGAQDGAPSPSTMTKRRRRSDRASRASGPFSSTSTLRASPTPGWRRPSPTSRVRSRPAASPSRSTSTRPRPRRSDPRPSRRCTAWHASACATSCATRRGPVLLVLALDDTDPAQPVMLRVTTTAWASTRRAAAGRGPLRAAVLADLATESGQSSGSLGTRPRHALAARLPAREDR